MNNQRILWVDYARAFSVLCVILYHTQLPAPFSALSYFLCLPIFFFCAGFLHHSSSFSCFLKKRMVRLLIPYVIFGIIAYLLWLVTRHYGEDAASISSWWRPLAGMLYGTSDRLLHNRPLWFLTALFSLELVYNLLDKISKKYIKWAAIMILLLTGWLNSKYCPIILPWGIGAASVMLIFYAIADAIKERLLFLPVPTLVLLLLMGIFATAVAFYFNPHIKISYNQFGNMFFFLLGVTGVIALWMSISMLLARLPVHLRFLQFIGSNTLTILCLHMPLFSIIKGITYFIFHLPLSIYQTVTGSLLLFIGSLILLLPICWLLKKYAQWLVGH